MVEPWQILGLTVDWITGLTVNWYWPRKNFTIQSGPARTRKVSSANIQDSTARPRRGDDRWENSCILSGTVWSLRFYRNGYTVLPWSEIRYSWFGDRCAPTLIIHDLNRPYWSNKNLISIVPKIICFRNVPFKKSLGSLIEFFSNFE